MPLCGNRKGADCAHEATRQLSSFGINLRNCQGCYCCEFCQFPIIAHQVGEWASKYKWVNECQSQGTYLIYQVSEFDGQAHVYVYHNGQSYGNGNYNQPHNNKKGRKDIHKNLQAQMILEILQHKYLCPSNKRKQL